MELFAVPSITPLAAAELIAAATLSWIGFSRLRRRHGRSILAIRILDDLLLKHFGF